MKLKEKSSFEAFKDNLLKTIRDWKYWTDYESIIRKFELFEDFTKRIGVVDKNEFEEKFLKLTVENKKFLLCTPLFSAIRMDKIYVIDEKGEELEFNYKNISPKDALEFLRQVGFFKIFNKFEKVNIPHYLMGVETGLDSNGRKNRGGKLMENFVAEKLKAHKIKFIREVPFNKIKEIFNVKILKQNLKNKRFDFVFTSRNTIFLVETNFFNSGGSKINETLRSFIQLQNEIKTQYSSELEIKFIYITDGAALTKDLNGLRDAFNAIEYMYNIHDLEKGIFID